MHLYRMALLHSSENIDIGVLLHRVEKPGSLYGGTVSQE